jgi:hypothetical protein
METSNEKILKIVKGIDDLCDSDKKELYFNLYELKRIIKQEVIADLDKQIETFKDFQKFNR